jgi:hypothetical protein
MRGGPCALRRSRCPRRRRLLQSATTAVRAWRRQTEPAPCSGRGSVGGSVHHPTTLPCDACGVSCRVRSRKSPSGEKPDAPRYCVGPPSCGRGRTFGCSGSVVSARDAGHIGQCAMSRPYVKGRPRCAAVSAPHAAATTIAPLALPPSLRWRRIDLSPTGLAQRSGLRPDQRRSQTYSTARTIGLRLAFASRHVDVPAASVR